MHPFASHLIAVLCGGLVTALYANHYAEKRAVAAFIRGRTLEQEAQALRNSARARKAARTRKEKQS